MRIFRQARWAKSGINVQEINKHQIFVAFTVVLILSMTIYHDGHFRDLFSYYEDGGEKTYDIENDGWSVDLDSQFEMADEFDLMLKNIDDYEYPANSVIVVDQGTMSGRDITMISAIVHNSTLIPLPRVLLQH